jgi:short-subunit dehydrogenase
MDLSGQTVLVTGADGGIGRALTEELARRDVHLLAGMRDTGNFTPVRRRAAREVRPVRMELSSRDEIEACLSELNGERVDVLINNAGRFDGGLLEHQELDEIYSMTQANFAGLIHLTKALTAPMLARRHGKIVNNASIAGYVPFPGAAVYSATKGGVVGFTEALRRELQESDVTVLEVVTPGVGLRAALGRYVQDRGHRSEQVGGEDRRRHRGRRRSPQPNRGRALGQAGVGRARPRARHCAGARFRPLAPA